MKLFLLILIVTALNSCIGLPLYQNHSELTNNLRKVAIVTDKKKMSLSIKKLLGKLPFAGSNLIILKIELKLKIHRQQPTHKERRPDMK